MYFVNNNQVREYLLIAGHGFGNIPWDHMWAFILMKQTTAPFTSWNLLLQYTSNVVKIN